MLFHYWPTFHLAVTQPGWNCWSSWRFTNRKPRAVPSLLNWTGSENLSGALWMWQTEAPSNCRLSFQRVFCGLSFKCEINQSDLSSVWLLCSRIAGSLKMSRWVKPITYWRLSTIVSVLLGEKWYCDTVMYGSSLPGTAVAPDWECICPAASRWWFIYLLASFRRN